MQAKNLTSKQTIGDRIKMRRQLHDLTQRALAEKVGISAGAVGRMESERDYVTSRPTIIALSQVLGCDPDWLETGEGSIYGKLKSAEEVRETDRKIKSFLDSLPAELRLALSEHTLAVGHYRDMESLLEMALKTRSPLKDQAEEDDFQWMLRRWSRKRLRGREALMRGIDVLDELAKTLLRDHIVESVIKKENDRRRNSVD
jgi:transcriptional regulator with XRE-family HTH domain